MALGTVIRSFATPAVIPEGLTWDGHDLWSADFGARRIYQIDINGIVKQTLVGGGGPLAGLAWDGTFLWSATNLGNIDQVDIETDTVIRSVAPPYANPVDLAWDGRFLWNIDLTNVLIWKIDTSDPAGLRWIRSLPAPATPRGLTFDGSYLWCTGDTANRIYKIDPRDGTVDASFASPGLNPSALTWDGRCLWHADYNTDRIYQIMVN